MNITVRELTKTDKIAFISAMQRSQALHHPWVNPPITSKEFDDFLERYQQSNQKSYLACDDSNNIIGVFNVSEIVRGIFQNAYLGFFAVDEFANQGYMSASLKIVLNKIFNELKLHRIEANIQPDNIRSIQLVKTNRFRYEGFSPRYLKINNVWRGHEHWVMTYEDFILNDADTLKKDHIDIVSYDHSWPDKANVEMDILRAILPANSIIDIQHVGSTAISGMAAKPIIDIQIATPSLEQMKLIAIPALHKLGYEFWYDNPDPERLFFVKGMPPYGEKRTHHVHIVELDSKHWREKILFRDYLITHPECAREYQALKAELAKQYPYEREAYTTAKTEFINKILNRCQKWGQA